MKKITVHMPTIDITPEGRETGKLYAYKNLGVLRDQMTWADRDKFSKIPLYFEEDSEIESSDPFEVYLAGGALYVNPAVAKIYTENVTTVLLDPTTYPELEPENPIRVKFIHGKKREDSNEHPLCCFIHTKPNVNGIKKRGKVFPANAWEDVCEGPAMVSISSERIGYGLVKGEMIRFDQICLPEMQFYAFATARYGCNRDNGLLGMIVHPLRGTYFAHRMINGVWRFYYTDENGEATFTDEYSSMIERDYDQYGVTTIRIGARMQYFKAHGGSEEFLKRFQPLYTIGMDLLKKSQSSQE